MLQVCISLFSSDSAATRAEMRGLHEAVVKIGHRFIPQVPCYWCSHSAPPSELFNVAYQVLRIRVPRGQGCALVKKSQSINQTICGQLHCTGSMQSSCIEVLPFSCCSASDTTRRSSHLPMLQSQSQRPMLPFGSGPERHRAAVVLANLKPPANRFNSMSVYF